MHKIFFYNKFIIRLYMFRALYAHHQGVQIVLYSIWYHHTCRWPSGAQVESGLQLCNINFVDVFMWAMYNMVDLTPYSNEKHCVSNVTWLKTYTSLHKKCWECPPFLWLSASVLFVTFREIHVRIFRRGVAADVSNTRF